MVVLKQHLKLRQLGHLSRRLNHRVNHTGLRLRRSVIHHRRAFSRTTLTAIAATAVDFSTIWVLVEFAHLYYVAANLIAATCGAITNFSLNRLWAFDHGRHGHAHRQAVRYAIVSAASLLLNTSAVFCFTEFAHLRYLISKFIGALIVGWFWNYPMHRYYVFRPR